MVRNRTFLSRLFDNFNIGFLALLVLACLFPLWYTFCISISDKSAANSGLVTVYPIGFSLSSYKEILGDRLFFNSFRISILRTVLGTAISLAVCVMMAYPLAKAKRELSARNVFMWLLVFCMIFNGGMIPWYLTVQGYNLIDSIWALVFAGGVPVFNVILIMNFFRAIPKELEEAAVMDGAGPWTILLRVYIPLSWPVLATVGLFVGVYHWNEFFNGLVLMNTAEKYPLQTYIQQMVVNIPAGTSLTPEQYRKLAVLSNVSLNGAKVFIAMIPMLAIYPFVQKYFVTGIMMGSVKE
jgi:putative aldouronate transport system permease protein